MFHSDGIKLAGEISHRNNHNKRYKTVILHSVYMCVCVCVCVYIYIYIKFIILKGEITTNFSSLKVFESPLLKKYKIRYYSWLNSQEMIMCSTLCLTLVEQSQSENKMSKKKISVLLSQIFNVLFVNRYNKIRIKLKTQTKMKLR